MTASPIRESLERLNASPDPLCRATASAVLDYLTTRDPELVLKIPPGAPGEAGEAASLAITTCVGHPDSDTLLELVSLLIGEHRYRDPLVYPSHYRGGIGNSMLHTDAAGNSYAGPRALLAAARRVAVPDASLARYLVLEHGHLFNLGWTPSGKSLPFGANSDPRLFEANPPGSWEPLSPIDELIWNLPDKELAEVACADLTSSVPGRFGGRPQLPPPFLGLLARLRPSTLDLRMERAAGGKGYNLRAWQMILLATDRFDDRALELASKLKPSDRLGLLIFLSHLRGNRYLELARAAALETGKESHATAMALLADHFPEDLSSRMTKAIAQRELDGNVPDFILEKSFEVMASRWNGCGRAVFAAVLASPVRALGGSSNDGGSPTAHSYAIGALTGTVPPLPIDELKGWTSKAAEELGKVPDKKEVIPFFQAFWSAVVSHNPGPLRDELLVLLGDKSKTLRQIAVKGLSSIADPDLLEKGWNLMVQGRLDQKLGACALLEAAGNPTDTERLRGLLATEANDKVRTAIREAVEVLGARHGGSTPPAGDDAGIVSLAELEASFAKDAPRLKLPPTSWLKPETLPQLFAKNGASISSHAVTFLLAKQSKHKTLDAAQDLLPLLSHIDRDKSPPFALALVEGFLNSEQAASDRWALALGGLLGDNRIIPPLLSRIADWCENSRHKLAEYAAQAISLLPGNEPLMVLDTLANRYRSKFKNVGKACAAAFNAAAQARGITPDELGDLVVPDFGFDGDSIRRFEWDGGGASAELGADFKLSWFDPETDKAWKSLPASAPAEVKEEVKTLGKLLREAVKGQTARLEMALVRQRRWPVARWRELYEDHPLLRSFASGLVWGIYDASGSLLRTFRRYPNGLLANSGGDLEELPEADTSIGMIHPLELDAAALEAWGAHLARFKVKQPFPQIARPVELLDPLHGNRREIALTKDKKVGAGTFKSRSEKRGWFRGSVIDGGGISSIYKPFPGAGFEAILTTENYYMGIDPMDSVELGAAYFVKADSVTRGGYTYDEPDTGDPRVLRFDQVPAVVWSETITDLKAIIGA